MEHWDYLGRLGLMLLPLVSLPFSLVNSERALSVFITWKLRYVDQHEQAKKYVVHYTFFSLNKKKKTTNIHLHRRLAVFQTPSVSYWLFNKNTGSKDWERSENPVLLTAIALFT